MSKLLVYKVDSQANNALDSVRVAKESATPLKPFGKFSDQMVKRKMRATGTRKLTVIKTPWSA